MARGAEGRRKPSLSPPAPSAAPGGPATSAIRFTTSAETAASAPPVPPAEPHGWTKVWLGRTAEMAELEQALVEPRGALKAVAICAVQGMAGVGKTYLAERFAWEHAASFPGGVKRLALQPDRPADVARLLDELAAQLDAPGRPAEIRARLLAPRALVHVDNADNEEAAKAAADLWRALPGCALVVTGRYEPLGSGGGWARVEVPPFDEATALALLSAEGRPPRPGEDEAFRTLAGELGCLPLALSLAAAHLREGLSPGEFLALLEEEELDVSLVDPAQGDDAPARRNLRKTFTLSLDLLRRSLGERGDALVHALGALGHAPLAGVGASLGAAITGLSATDFRRLTLAAVRLSVLERSAGDPPRWRLHPLLAKLVRDEAEAPAVLARTTVWFVARLPVESAADPRPQGERWNEVHEETVALTDWLGRVPVQEMPAVERAGSLYAGHAGPFALWATFCAKLLAAHEAPKVRSNALFTLSWVAKRAGDLDKAHEAATQMEAVDRAEGWEREAAIAAGLRADIHEARGQLDEALHIRQHDELPVYEKLGDLRSRAVTLGQIADIHMARGQLDEALHIRQHDELPVYEKLGDLRARAVTLGQIADIHMARGQLDEALHIRRHDELPVFEKLGDLRERAITLGQIADIHMARGQLDEALHIRQHDELPVYEKLGDLHARAVTLGKIADIHMARRQLDEALHIRRHDELPVYEKLGDIRARAVTLGKIADIHKARGQLDEALHIRQHDELPVYEQLGARRDILVCQAHIALTLLARAHEEDRPEAERLLRLALTSAAEMKLPAADTIRDWLRHHGFDP